MQSKIKSITWQDIINVINKVNYSKLYCTQFCDLETEPNRTKHDNVT